MEPRKGSLTIRSRLRDVGGGVRRGVAEAVLLGLEARERGMRPCRDQSGVPSRRGAARGRGEWIGHALGAEGSELRADPNSRADPP